MVEATTKTYINSSKEITQCDIFRDIEFLEYFREEEQIIQASKIVFPLVMVLTQSCDLQQDYNAREKIEKEEKGNHDKFLISVIVVPLYNFDDFMQGQHLSQLGYEMTNHGGNSAKARKRFINNENKRYHYLRFPEQTTLVDSIIDFKHYFTVTLENLKEAYDERYVCSVEILYRELILQRFSNFLSRIGLPDPE